MAQTGKLLLTLKRLLKQHGFKYKDVAAALDISESRVKYLFAEESFTLKRLDTICEMMGLEMSDVIAEMRESNAIRSLTREQETELVNDPSLLLVANSVLNKWSFEDIQLTYQFSEHQLIQLLAKLDRLKLINLLPNNRFKLLVDRNFSWLKHGPIAEFFEEQVKKEFFNSHFNGPGEKRMYLVGMLSRESNRIFQRKLESLSEEFHSLHYQDERLPIQDRFGTSLVLGMRLWEPQIFENKRREADKRQF